jgi:hypothetical protein
MFISLTFQKKTGTITLRLDYCTGRSSLRYILFVFVLFFLSVIAGLLCRGSARQYLST